MRRGTRCIYNTYFRIEKISSNKYEVYNLFLRKVVDSFLTLADAKESCK